MRRFISKKREIIGKGTSVITPFRSRFLILERHGFQKKKKKNTFFLMS